MKISTKFILSISIMFLGYFITLVVSHTLGKHAQSRLDYAVRSLFPSVIESRKAFDNFDRQFKAYQEAVVVGDLTYLEEAQSRGQSVQQALSAIIATQQLPQKILNKTVTLAKDISSWSQSAQDGYSNLLESGTEIDKEFVEKSRSLSMTQKRLQDDLAGLVTLMTDSLMNEHDRLIYLTKMQTLSNLLLFCAVAVVTLITVSIMLKKVVDPIQSLAQTARLIQEGELDRRADVKGKDEIGELGVAFNSMTDKLSHAVSSLEAEIVERKRAQEEVARHRDHLEDLVNERTAELTKANKELVVSEKQNRALVDTASDAGIGIIVLQNVGDLPGMIRYVNSHISKLSGYSEEELLTKNMLDILHPEFHEKAIADYGKTISGEEVLKNAEYCGLTKDNRKVPVEISSGETMYQGEKAIVVYISDISERKAEEEKLAQAQRELVEKAHQAGMADIATGTLHNVGNILNSVKTSAQVVSDIIKNSQIKGLEKANEMLRENIDTLETFICENPKGKKLMQYYLKIEESVQKEQEKIIQHVERLNDKINAIVEVIVAQQSYAGTNALIEEFALHEIINDALTMQSGTTERYNINVQKNFNEIPKVKVQKVKLVHILINLIRNAKDSMLEIPAEQRILRFTTERNGAFTYIKVTDSGHGISREDLNKIFTHGYTTKKDGHGFGLHSSANYMTEMGGEMWAESEGKGKGATFVLKFSNNI